MTDIQMKFGGEHLHRGETLKTDVIDANCVKFFPRTGFKMAMCSMVTWSTKFFSAMKKPEEQPREEDFFLPPSSAPKRNVDLGKRNKLIMGMNIGLLLHPERFVPGASPIIKQLLPLLNSEAWETNVQLNSGKPCDVSYYEATTKTMTRALESPDPGESDLPIESIKASQVPIQLHEAPMLMEIVPLESCLPIATLVKSANITAVIPSQALVKNLKVISPSLWNRMMANYPSIMSASFFIFTNLLLFFLEEDITTLECFRKLNADELAEFNSEHQLKLGHRVALRKIHAQVSREGRTGTLSGCPSKRVQEADIYSMLIEKHLQKGLNIKEAVHAIGTTYGLWRSVRTAQWHAQRRKCGNCRSVAESPIDKVIPLVKEELDGPCRGMGASTIWKTVKNRPGVKVKRQTVRDVVEALIPGRGEKLKKSRLKRRVYRVKGPNHIWHVDGNDKLKPYGLCLSGCIDGFSRKIIWLDVARTNKNPTLVCSYFLNAVRQSEGLPRVVRVDRGTENANIATCQELLRAEHDDTLANVAVMYGSSNHNQRIERFWSYLRQVLLQDYMNVFKDYIFSGLVDTSNSLHLECIAFSFLGVLRKELRNTVKLWNAHRIRNMANTDCPSGIPNVLFQYPNMFGFSDQGKPADQQLLVDCETMYATHNVIDVDPVFQQWAVQQVGTSLTRCDNLNDACRLFTELMALIHEFENQSS